MTSTSCLAASRSAIDFSVSNATPVGTVVSNDSWVVSYWADRTSNIPAQNQSVTTVWTPPASQVEREAAYNDSTGARVTSLLTDDGTPAPAGFRSGLTATADGNTDIYVMRTDGSGLTL